MNEHAAAGGDNCSELSPHRPPGTAGSQPALTMRDVLLAIRAGRLRPPPAAELLGLRIVDVGPGTAVFALLLRTEHLNATGTVNGGLLAALADYALCAAVNDVPAASSVATAGLNITYQRPATLATGELRANGRVLHRTPRTATVEASITDAAGDLHAHALATIVVRATT